MLIILSFSLSLSLSDQIEPPFSSLDGSSIFSLLSHDENGNSFTHIEGWIGDLFDLWAVGGDHYCRQDSGSHVSEAPTSHPIVDIQSAVIRKGRPQWFIHA